MGVSINLEGTYGKPGFLRRPPDPQDWLNGVREWLEEREGDQLLHSEIARREPRSPLTLYARLHPANEDFALQCPRPGRVFASLKTSGAGPGLHQHVCRLLHDMEAPFEVRWDPPNPRKGTGDPSDYFTNGDRGALEREFLSWLHDVAIQVHEMQEKDYEAIGISMPLTDLTFLLPGALYTSTGPRDIHWLRRAATDLLSGTDLFPWWDQARDAAYFRDRALVHMWTEVRWRPALTEAERATHQRVLTLLDRAAELDASLPLPRVEREEIRAYVDGVEPAARGKIGYFRGPVRHSDPARWSLEVPGELVQEFDDEGNWCAWDASRKVQLSSITIGNRGNHPKAAELLESDRQKLAGKAILELDAPPLHGLAAFHESDSPESHPYFLQGITAIDGGLAVCTIEFSRDDQRDWAEAVWRSVRHSGDLFDESD